MKNPEEYVILEAIANQLEISVAEAVLYCRNISRCFDTNLSVESIHFWISEIENKSPTVNEMAEYISKNDKSLRRISSYKNTVLRNYTAPHAKEIEIKETLIREIAELLPVPETEKLKEAREFLEQVAKLYPSVLRREKALINAVDYLVSQSKLSVYGVWKRATKYKKPSHVQIISTPTGGKQ